MVNLKNIPKIFTKEIPSYYIQVSSVDRRLLKGEPIKGKKILNVGCGGYIFDDICLAMKGADVIGIDYFREPATIPDDVDVLVAHEPAFGLADECSDPFHTKMIPHCGSKAVRRLVDRYHPEILVAGHVHSFQKHRVENTLAITLPAALSDPIIMITGKENNKIVLSFG